MATLKKEDALKLINDSTDAEFVVRTASEEQTFLANFKEQEVEKDIKPIIGKLHSQYEQDFESVTGLKKPDGEKGYNWIKTEAARMKASADKLSQAETKLTKLEEQIKDGKTDEAAKAKIEELTGEVKRLENLHKKAKTEWDESISRERSEFRSTRIKSELNHAMLGFKFLDPAIVAKDVQETYINKTINELAQIADFDDTNRLIFRNAEKEVMRNKDAAVMTPSELLEAKLAAILDKGKHQPGLGTDSKGKGKDNEPQTDVVVPVTVDTPQKLTTYLRANYPDMTPSSKKYIEAYAKYSKEFKK